VQLLPQDSPAGKKSPPLPPQSSRPPQCPCSEGALQQVLQPRGGTIHGCRAVAPDPGDGGSPVGRAGLQFLGAGRGGGDVALVAGRRGGVPEEVAGVSERPGEVLRKWLDALFEGVSSTPEDEPGGEENGEVRRGDFRRRVRIQDAHHADGVRADIYELSRTRQERFSE